MPSKRLQDLTEAHNIKPLKMPPKYSRPIKLDGTDDPILPRQIAEELTKRNDVLEVVASTNKSQGRVPNKTQV